MKNTSRSAFLWRVAAWLSRILAIWYGGGDTYQQYNVLFRLLKTSNQAKQHTVIMTLTWEYCNLVKWTRCEKMVGSWIDTSVSPTIALGHWPIPQCQTHHVFPTFPCTVGWALMWIQEAAIFMHQVHSSTVYHRCGGLTLWLGNWQRTEVMLLAYWAMTLRTVFSTPGGMRPAMLVIISWSSNSGREGSLRVFIRVATHCFS